MATKNRPIKKLGTVQFLERLVTVIDMPGIKTFQWSGDGKSVVVNSKHYKDEISVYEELSILKKFKSVAALRDFLCTHGFKRIARRSSAEVHVFRHPGLSIKGVVNTKGRHKRTTKCLDSIGLSRHQRETLKKSGREELETTSASSPSDIFFLPEKKKNARHLYQYINYTLPVPQCQLAQDAPTDTSAEASLSSTA